VAKTTRHVERVLLEDFTIPQLLPGCHNHPRLAAWHVLMVMENCALRDDPLDRPALLDQLENTPAARLHILLD
jgi:hypothetical protein